MRKKKIVPLPPMPDRKGSPRSPRPRRRIEKGNLPKSRRPKPRREESDEDEAEPSSRARVAGGHKVWKRDEEKLNMQVFKGKFPWRDSSLVEPMDHEDVGFTPGLEHRRETRERETREAERGSSRGGRRAKARPRSASPGTSTGFSGSLTLTLTLILTLTLTLTLTSGHLGLTCGIDRTRR